MPQWLKDLSLAVAAVCIPALLLAAVYTATASAAPGATTYVEYRNDRWHFSLAVPATMMVSEHEREGGGQTAQFMDAAGDKELIISAWPYTQLDLTLGGEGTPSTTWDQPDHLEIVDVVHDDTFTVLFQKNGFRYIVVSLPEHEAWLTDILTTWRFTN